VTALPLPPLRAAWRSAVAAPGRVAAGVPVLEGTVLSQRRGLATRRVDLAAATSVEVLPRRPRRLALRAGAGGTAVQVDLLRIDAIPGWTRTPAELEALAAALEPSAAPVAEALRRQAAFLSGDLPEPYLSPLAAFVGKSGSVVDDIGHGLP
jgi:hypothetical protein